MILLTYKIHNMEKKNFVFWNFSFGKYYPQQLQNDFLYLCVYYIFIPRHESLNILKNKLSMSQLFILTSSV